MNDLLIARAQVGLSFFIIAGYFGIKIAEGLQLIQATSGDMNELIMLIAFFWFQRQRTQEKPNA
jgi:hypothetical protein